MVLNIVWTGTSFSVLSRFTDTVLAHEPVRLRFVANACPPSEIEAMEAYAARHPGRITDVTVVSSGAMLRHGDCLDEVLRTSDDGAVFGLLDPDILVTGPFLGPLLDALVDHDVVTSGTELWSVDNVRPEGHIGVNGEIFFDRDGYVFGSPHLALYRTGPLRATMARWDVGFSSAGNDIPEATKARVAELGRAYWIYDTGKLVNILLQGDGASLVHLECEHVVHVGGLAHFLAPPQPVPDEHGNVQRVWGQTDRWGEWEAQGDRFYVAGQAARMLLAQSAGAPLPPVPEDLDPSMADRIGRLRAALETLRPVG